MIFLRSHCHAGVFYSLWQKLFKFRHVLYDPAKFINANIKFNVELIYLDLELNFKGKKLKRECCLDFKEPSNL